MKPFTKIINTISSKEKLYTTPFLNFDYSHRTVARKIKKDNTNVLRGALKRIEEDQTELEKRKSKLNKEALTRILTEEENKQLAEIFTKSEQLKMRKVRIQEQIKNLLVDD
jgi:hypothetical protein